MRKLSIPHRYILSVLIAILFIGVTAAYFVNRNYESMIAVRQAELKQHIDIAISLILENRKKAKQEGLTQEEADKKSFETLEKMRFGQEGYFYIFEEGVVRYHGPFPYLIGKDLINQKDMKGNYLIRRQVEEIAKNGESSFRYPWLKRDTDTPTQKISYNRAVPGTNYWIGTGVYLSDLENDFWTRIGRSILVVGSLALILATLSFFISRSITAPLRRVRARMVSLAAGDITSPVPEIEAHDEVGDMARSVEIFRENKKYSRELEQLNIEIEKQAHHDPLTGLPNRRYFQNQFNAIREECIKSGNCLALFHIDLDRFKDTNDTMGHAAGDLVLKRTAEVLKSLTREQDFIARIGGDEFLVLGPCSGSMEKTTKLAAKIIETLSEPLPYEGRLCRFGASIGITVEKADDIELAALIRHADIALYKAKDKGRNRYEIYSESMGDELHARNRTIEEFMNGLDLGHLVPFYQPQFDLQTMDIVGLEVLARWIHPEKGILTPDSFLSIAEDQRVMGRINKAIAIQALRDCILLKNSGIHVPKVAINISLDSLKDPDLLPWLDSLMPFPTNLSMELIESISFENCDTLVSNNLKEIRKRGIEIEIDDFGSGHASILGLLEVKPDRLKIDRKLVEPIVTSQFHKKLLKSIAEMGTSLNMGIIAEGVETKEQLQYLRDLGIDEFQGFIMAQPMSFSDIKLFMEKESWRKDLENEEKQQAKVITLNSA